MQTIEVTRTDWKPSPPPLQRHHYAATPPADARIIDRPSILVADGGATVVGLVDQLGQESALGVGGLLDRFAKMRWEGTVANANEFRLSGFNNAHRVIGYTAPVPLRRRHGCSSCQFNSEEPSVAERTERIARRLWEIFEADAPAEAAAHRKLVDDQIHPDWHWGGAPWTSGIINRTAALPYHLDAGNLKDAWSAMLVLRRNTAGGLLHLPEYGIWIACPSRAVVIFPGQSVWHGVTPIVPTAPRSYRYSMVLYAKAGCRECGPMKDEARRAARVRTERESAPTA